MLHISITFYLKLNVIEHKKIIQLHKPNTYTAVHSLKIFKIFDRQKKVLRYLVGINHLYL